MTQESFADLFQEKTVNSQDIRPGDKIEAVIADISGENIFLDLGGKSEGVLNAAECRNADGELTVSVGDKVFVFFLARRGGEMVFTARVGSGHVSSEELEQAFQAGIPVKGKVTAEIKGGFQVTVAGQRAFCPYSQMGLHRVESAADTYLDQEMIFKIIEFGNKGRNIIVSARAVQEQEREQRREQLRESLHEGDRVEGTVSSIREFGAFVDLGGADGLIPISELAWGQTERVDDVLSIGQQVAVVIKKIDWAKERISLSLRDTLENPWDRVEEKYAPASIHNGTVSRLTAFGAFISLEPGVDGLLHISRLGSGRRINHPREVLSIGQAVTVKIDGIDKEQQRISLVPEDYTSKAEEDQNYTPPPKDAEPKSMGTFADLLNKAAKKKR
ncbi:MAG: SSU ribosomal protein S1P [Candidatus Electronema aureum]|uniref:SSU ribosomal protein S1P n=1 Tax=Candidatus Electronema aureum TaxID=2005002 RepID=A0A521G3J8_9BACT|nr:MAG: SSU ribosomal protein S1P [Candidatus Electronema aureum]